MDFKDLICWVTGASSGIGLAISRQLAHRGSTVVLSSRSKDKLLSASKFIGVNYRTILMPCDVANPEQVQLTYEKLRATNLSVNLLVNNAGFYISKSFINTTLTEFDETYNTLVRGTFLCTQAALPSMIKSNFGIIINIVSVVVNKIFTSSSIYASAKSAVMMMGKVLREEVRCQNIKIMNVYPGATASNIWSPRTLDKFGERMMTPDQVASAILCNIESSLANGVMVEELVLRPQLGDL
ncbi:MAG: SDR family NAD(P)-dependent oxidoreductase [Candidatus Kapaibacteriales bacterium]